MRIRQINEKNSDINGFASVMLTSLPAGAWFFAGARGVLVVPRPPGSM